MSGLVFLRRHRQSIGMWLLAALFALACVFLGRWQLHRYQDKHHKAALVASNYDAPAVPLARLLAGPSARFDPGDQWRPVRVSGRYDAAGTHLVRNRPRNGGGSNPVYGYEVVVPLRLPDGGALLVDRGWLPNGTAGSTPGDAPDSVPAPPSGEVTVEARLRHGEPARGRDLPAGQVGSINLSQVGADLRYPLYAAYGGLVREDPAPPAAPAALDPPEIDGGEGINASYAVQWGVFALLGLGFPLWVARRRREAAEEDAGDGETPREPVPARRRRIWDDEDE